MNESDLPPISVPIPRWHFTWDEIRNKSASRKRGMSYDDELRKRQESARFIQKMADRLNQGMKDNRSKISQLCVCATIVQVNRFFYFHSFDVFDYRDVCAAGLFLCGKSEECPRKLEHVVRIWWSLRFESHPTLPDKYFKDAMNRIHFLENCILQTIAFDLRIDLPHTVVLQQMNSINHGKRMLTEAAYFFATDVLCVTDWSIRYTAPEIAAMCIYAVCVWADHELDYQPQPWYKSFAPSLTEEKLREGMTEFLSVYTRYKEIQGSLRLGKFSQKGTIKFPPPGVHAEIESRKAEGEAPLPPPPAPPVIRKTNYDEYKASFPYFANTTFFQKNAARHAEQNAHLQTAPPPPQPPRQSFMPDLSDIGARSRNEAAPRPEFGARHDIVPRADNGRPRDNRDPARREDSHKEKARHEEKRRREEAMRRSHERPREETDRHRKRESGPPGGGASPSGNPPVEKKRFPPENYKRRTPPHKPTQPSFYKRRDDVEDGEVL
ncbi:unnamed protein product, partial [Mesorhabditis spiculigera]